MQPCTHTWVHDGSITTFATFIHDKSTLNKKQIIEKWLTRVSQSQEIFLMDYSTNIRRQKTFWVEVGKSNLLSPNVIAYCTASCVCMCVCLRLSEIESFFTLPSSLLTLLAGLYRRCQKSSPNPSSQTNGLLQMVHNMWSCLIRRPTDHLNRLGFVQGSRSV